MADLPHSISIYSDQIKQHLQAGSVIAYPTEGVWGLGCDPSNKQAVLKILELKQRPFKKGMILVADSVDRLAPYLQDLPSSERLLPKNSQGRAITWVVNHGGKAPDWISGGRASLAVRISQHPVVCTLCQSAQMPLVSTSANPSSMPSAITEQEVSAYFPKGVDLIVSGALGGQNGASEIRDFASGDILREA